MECLTIITDTRLDPEIKTYLLTIQGIANVMIDPDDESNCIHIFYYSKRISIKIIQLELSAFFNSKAPFIIGFDKHPNKKTENHQFILQNICCEYCLMNMIEELLLISGIEQVTTNFNSYNLHDIKIEICYDLDLVDLADIKQRVGI